MGFLDFIFDPGKKDRERANDLNQQAINNQAGVDQFKIGLLKGLLDRSDMFLLGKQAGQPAELPAGTSKVTKDRFQQQEITGALPRAEDWTNRYFSFLSSSPDTTYNRQRTTFERGLKDAEKNINMAARRRGRANDGFNLGQLRDLGVQRARGLSDLEGQRIDRRGQTIATGANLAQSLLDRVLNMAAQGSGMAGGFQTRVPYLQQSQANQLMAGLPQGSVGQDLVAQATSGLLDRVFPSRQTTVPTSSGGGGGLGGILTSALGKGISSIVGGLF